MPLQATIARSSRTEINGQAGLTALRRAPFAGIQSGLERAEQVAVAAEEAKQRAEQSMKLTLALVGLSVVLIALSLRRRNR